MDRREFAAAASALVTLTLLGCDRQSPGGASSGDDGAGVAASGGGGEGEGNRHRAALATEPFLAGAAARFAAAGVYDDFKKAADDPANKGVWLVSDGRQLVALSATCTHMGCATQWQAEPGEFDCPCHHSRFDLEGQPLAGAKARRPLERCAVRLVATPQGEQVEVDPTRRFREPADWTDPQTWVPLV